MALMTYSSHNLVTLNDKVTLYTQQDHIKLSIIHEHAKGWLHWPLAT